MIEVIQQKAEEYLEASFKRAYAELNTCQSDLSFVPPPKKINEYQRYIQALQTILGTVRKVNPAFQKEKIKEAVIKHYEGKVVEHGQKLVTLNDSFENRLDTVESTIIQQAKSYNQSLQKDLEENNQVFLQLEEKRLELETYENDVVDLCSAYGITTEDITISNATFTTEELSDIYDEYIKYMKKSKNGVNPVTKFRDLVRDNIVVEGTVLLVILILMFTTVLNYVAIVFFASIVYTQLKAKKKAKTYSILLGLIYNIRPLEMGFRNTLDESELLSEEIDEEETPELQPLAEEWAQAIQELEEQNPEIEYKAALIELQTNTQEIDDMFYVRLKAFNEAQSKMDTYISELIVAISAEYEDAKSKIVRLGDAISNDTCFNTEFRLGLEEGVLEIPYDMGLRNIIIHPSKDKEETKKFIQLLFANALSNVRAGKLITTVFDPYNFGQDLVMFYNEAIMDLIVFENNKLDRVLDPLKAYAESNMKSMQGLDINQYNIDAASVGKSTKEYRLLIVLSEPKTFEENEALKSFMAYSAKLGVFIWLVSDIELPNTKIFKRPFEGVQHPYKFDSRELAGRTVTTLIDTIKNGLTDSLDWKTKTLPVICPDDKIWTFTTDKYIELDPGFWEGDPTQADGYTVGHDGNVHGIIVGGTGAGKSVFINQLINTACRKYSPRELELWIADYKGSEGAFYLPTVDHPKVLPHLRACLCTSDGEYAGSLFKALREEAEARYKYIIDVGFKSIYEYNTAVRAGRVYQYTDEDGKTCYTTDSNLNVKKRQLGEEDLVPRTLFINDEFQVIFEKAEPTTVEQIKKDITYLAKVARAAGVHVIFASQSMKGTISEDTMDQFTLRFALRCAPEVSKSVLGTNFAGEIKEKFGYLYVRSQGDKSLQAQKRYRTPYAPDKDLRANIDMLYDLAEKRGYKKKDLISYDEKTKHNIREIDEVYQNLGANVPEGLMLLGPRMTYSSNKAPENVVLSATNNNHIMSCFLDTADAVNFYRTIRKNISKCYKAQTFVNCQAADLHYLCEIDKDTDPEELSYTSDKTSIQKLISLFQAVYTVRQSKGLQQDPVYYILIGWDKAVGFGVEKDYDATTALANLLQVCGEYNMHFIFINSAMKPVPLAVTNACKFKICGKCDEDSSYTLLNSKLGSKVDENLSNGYMYLNDKGQTTRCKIYQSKIEREVKQDKLVL